MPLNQLNRIQSHNDLDKPSRLGKKRRWKISRLSYQQHNRREQIKLLTNYAISAGLILAVVGFFGLVILYAWTSRLLPDPQKLLERNIEQSTTILDRKEETVLYQIHGDINRKLIKLQDLPDYVKWASIVAEDDNFYNHSGFDVGGIVKAGFATIGIGPQRGGSTITQQFVKNAILTNERSIIRKFKELILAYRIEKKFAKDEILQLYFNEIPYGSVVYGIEAAAQTFFDKSAKDLTLAEAAMLAGIPQRPTYFSPYGSHLDELKARQEWILDRLVKFDHISKDQAAAAKAEEIKFKPKEESLIAPHFVMYVRELLAEQYGETFVEEGGLRVTTTLDVDYQKAAEKSVADHWQNNKDKYNAGNAALVSLDTKTGDIMAMVGSADFFNEDIDGQVNVALRPRQPGSSFKPLVYTAAFSKGYTPETTLYDVETVFKTDMQDYVPHNYDGGEHGPVSMRSALAGSLNIPAVKTLYLAGIDYTLKLAEDLGYTTLKDRSRFGLSLVLGGGEVKLLEHTAAFATMAQEGEYHPPVAILKVQDANGKVLFEREKVETKKVLSPEIFRLTSSVLSDNAARAYIFGENNYLTLGSRPVAAKTGTTNDYHDAWTMGYTPSLATGVWVGNSDNAAMKRGADGSVVAAPIWNQFMKEVLADKPVEYFNAPPANDATKPVLRGEIAGIAPIKIDKASGKLATELTPPDYVEERVFSQHHTILYYVDKDDPRGPAPKNPLVDPQFGTWEEGIRKWVAKKGLVESNDPIPTEYDDVHTPDNKPNITITSPSHGQTINSNSINATVTASANRGLTRVEYWLDGSPLGTATSAPFSLNISLVDKTNGFHQLTAKAFDDVGNSAEQTIEVNFLFN